MRTASLTLQALVVLANSLLAEGVSQITLVDIRPLPGWKGDPVGNVAITTDEGTQLQLTKTASAQQPKASSSGLVGWVDCSKDGKPGSFHMVEGVPIGSCLILRNPNGTLITITAEKPIIEQWGFDRDGVHIVLKSRALHGPAVIERFTLHGVREGFCNAYEPSPPDWAKPYLDH